MPCNIGIGNRNATARDRVSELSAVSEHRIPKSRDVAPLWRAFLGVPGDLAVSLFFFPAFLNVLCVERSSFFEFLGDLGVFVVNGFRGDSGVGPR